MSRCPEHCRNQGHESVFCSFTYVLLNIFSFLLCVLAPSLLFCAGFTFFCTKSAIFLLIAAHYFCRIQECSVVQIHPAPTPIFCKALKDFTIVIV